ncbi:MAG TPA: hypothetical protein EYQ50_16645 [Verrucomicrobiales bacterium]|nr:hypothetical protein [Verrucomicrobiales bacterium]
MLHVIVKHPGNSHPKLMGVLEKHFGEMGEDMQSHLNELYFGLAENIGMGTPQIAPKTRVKRNFNSCQIKTAVGVRQ